MDKLTYEQRIKMLSKIHADRYNDGGRRAYAGGPLLRNEPEHMRDEAEVTITAQAHAITAAIIADTTSKMDRRAIEDYLIENGYMPIPEHEECKCKNLRSSGSGSKCLDCGQEY